MRSHGLCPQSVFAAGGLVPVGFKHSWLSTKSLFAREASSAMATRSECEREAREAAANLVLSTVLPHSVRMGTRVLETLGNMREILSYDSIGCKQALPIFEELVKAGTELEHRLAEWLERRAAAPDTPPVKPQSPRQPIYLSVKRKASEQPEKPEKPEPEVTTFLLPRAAEP